MENIRYTIRKVPERTVVGISKRTCNADGRSIDDIPACWKEFLSQNSTAKIKNRAIPPTLYVVYSDYASDWRGEYSFLLGCGVTRAETVPEGMEVRRIPAQTYAVFNVKGKMPDELLGIWSTIWLSELPRTYTYDFEVYDKRFTRPASKEVDVYVAIDPEQLEKLKK
nr:GyrI-like domain-containing protein [uncultured Methanoregula sp.]